jgi:hypothetical protein
MVENREKYLQQIQMAFYYFQTENGEIEISQEIVQTFLER